MNHTKSRAASLHVLNRVLGYMLRLYALPFLVVILCIVISAGATVMGATFPQTLVDDYIVPMMNSGSTDFSSLGAAIIRLACIMAGGVVAAFLYNRIMVTISQGTMRRLRNDLFQRMESLPIQYFDTHAHGDIMSVYTNDVDTLRQLLSQSIPQVINSLVSMAATLVTMLILNPVLKIRYDGININKIKKPDLRRSLGIVLQDTHLFTGTVLENIRYGNLEATDEECMAALPSSLPTGSPPSATPTVSWSWTRVESSSGAPTTSLWKRRAPTTGCTPEISRNLNHPKMDRPVLGRSISYFFRSASLSFSS